MKLTRRIKRRTVPNLRYGFVAIGRAFPPAGYYKNRGLPAPWQSSIGSYSSVRFICSPGGTP